MESRFPAPVFDGRRLRSTAWNMRTTPLVSLAPLDLTNRGRRVAFGSVQEGASARRISYRIRRMGALVMRLPL